MENIRRSALAEDIPRVMLLSSLVWTCMCNLQAFLRKKWATETQYSLMKELWGFMDNRVSARSGAHTHNTAHIPFFFIKSRSSFSLLWGQKMIEKAPREPIYKACCHFVKGASRNEDQSGRAEWGVCVGLCPPKYSIKKSKKIENNKSQ